MCSSISLRKRETEPRLPMEPLPLTELTILLNRCSNRIIMNLNNESSLPNSSRVVTIRRWPNFFDPVTKRMTMVATDGTSGLSKAMTEKPDIILLDIIMPELDGFEVLHRLKSNSKTSYIPVVLLSNLSQPEQVSRGRQLGAKDYLVKSNVVPSKLVEKVKEFLSEK